MLGYILKLLSDLFKIDDEKVIKALVESQVLEEIAGVMELGLQRR